jgi:hypothetical protein
VQCSAVALRTPSSSFPAAPLVCAGVDAAAGTGATDPLARLLLRRRMVPSGTTDVMASSTEPPAE